MINKPLEQIEQTDIESLIANEVREGRTLEYKEQLPTNSDGDKKEFLADVSSFANAGGGDILFGVREKRDAAGKTTGIPESAPGLQLHNLDETILRLENIIRNGVAPRLVAHIQPVAGFDNGPVIVIRISQSWNSPHMVTFQDSGRFFSRTSAGKYLLDVLELRTAFNQSEAISQKIDRFWTNRLSKIISGQTPVRLEENARLILHFLPIASFSSAISIDLTRGDQFEETWFTPLGSLHGHRSRLNFDGRLTYEYGSTADICESYLQLFRSGIVETVNAYWLRRRPVLGLGEQGLVPLTSIEKIVITSLKNCMSLFREIDVPPPFGIRLAMSGVKGHKVLDPDRTVYTHSPYSLEQDEVAFPDVLVQDFDADPGQILKPIFDTMWQSGGWLRSQNYDENGNRKPDTR